MHILLIHESNYVPCPCYGCKTMSIRGIFMLSYRSWKFSQEWQCHSIPEQLHHPSCRQTLDVVSLVGAAHRNVIWCSHDKSMFVCSDVLNSLFPSQSIFIRVVYIVLCFVRLLEQWRKKISNLRRVGLLLKLKKDWGQKKVWPFDVPF